MSQGEGQASKLGNRQNMEDGNHVLTLCGRGQVNGP